MIIFPHANGEVDSTYSLSGLGLESVDAILSFCRATGEQDTLGIEVESITQGLQKKNGELGAKEASDLTDRVKRKKKVREIKSPCCF